MTDAEFQSLAELPSEAEWLANINSPKTVRAYRADVREFVAFVGIGLWLWSQRSERPALEGAFLRGAWYINELYDTVFGRPSERLAAFCADVVDPKIIDGAVNGVAGAFRGTGTVLRRTQTGYVRNYVLGITFGTVVVLGFMLTRMWWG